MFDAPDAFPERRARRIVTKLVRHDRIEPPDRIQAGLHRRTDVRTRRDAPLPFPV